jgi:NAD(P)-dependent dehydrogenase (short-subunit alcohol dehydrogenase family)
LNILVTGGSRGIGLGLVTRLKAEGHNVTSWSRTEGVDITDPAHLRKAARALTAPLDVVVHNAGAYIYEHDMTPRTPWVLGLFQLHVVAPLEIYHFLLQGGRLNPGALTLAISTNDVPNPQPWQVAYQCSKAGLEMLMATLALEDPTRRYLIYRAHVTPTGMWDPERGPAEYTLSDTVEEICRVILS